MVIGELEPGDATHYRYAFERMENGRLFFAFNSGYSDALVGNTWEPDEMPYISLGYFNQQMGAMLQPWTLAVAYLVLHTLLKRELDADDLQQGAIPYLMSPKRLKADWLAPFKAL